MPFLIDLGKQIEKISPALWNKKVNRVWQGRFSSGVCYMTSYFGLLTDAPRHTAFLVNILMITEFKGMGR